MTLLGHVGVMVGGHVPGYVTGHTPAPFRAILQLRCGPCSVETQDLFTGKISPKPMPSGETIAL